MCFDTDWKLELKTPDPGNSSLWPDRVRRLLANAQQPLTDEGLLAHFMASEEGVLPGSPESNETVRHKITRNWLHNLSEARRQLQKSGQVTRLFEQGERGPMPVKVRNPRGKLAHVWVLGRDVEYLARLARGTASSQRVHVVFQPARELPQAV
jgi:hypothetical protein